MFSLDSPLQAELLIDGIFTKAQVLTRFPEFGHKLREFLDKDYRELLFKSYRIIYKYNEDEDKVSILTIYHFARLLKNSPLFKDEF